MDIKSFYNALYNVRTKLSEVLAEVPELNGLPENQFLIEIAFDNVDTILTRIEQEHSHLIQDDDIPF